MGKIVVMIRTAFTGGSGQRIAVLGLSNHSLEQLRRGRSIKVDLTDLGIEGQVIIVWGTTDAAIVAELERQNIKLLT